VISEFEWRGSFKGGHVTVHVCTERAVKYVILKSVKRLIYSWQFYKIIYQDFFYLLTPLKSCIQLWRSSSTRGRGSSSK
jgi:hypothetical protein